MDLGFLLDAHLLDEPTIGLADAAAVGLIVGVIQVLRTAWTSLPARFIPLIALLSGVAWQVGIALTLEEPMWASVVISGIVLGLASSGLYSGGKTLIEGGGGSSGGE